VIGSRGGTIVAGRSSIERHSGVSRERRINDQVLYARMINVEETTLIV
jgi:hypothetical protein